jgi:hypothetical protein
MHRFKALEEPRKSLINRVKLVVSDLFAVPVLVLWVGFEKISN